MFLAYSKYCFCKHSNTYIFFRPGKLGGKDRVQARSNQVMLVIFAHNQFGSIIGSISLLKPGICDKRLYNFRELPHGWAGAILLFWDGIFAPIFCTNQFVSIKSAFSHNRA